MEFKKIKIMNKETETLKQELEEIQNTFLPKDETKLEDVCYTKNIEKWLKFINQRETDPGTHNIFDYEIIKNAEAFALGPVFSCNGKMEACSTFASDSLKEIKNSLNGKKYILYCISWQAIAEPINESDMKSLNITLDKTEDISGNFYRIGKNPKLRILFRGHILEN